ncbi:hypothetical protein Talka_00464 [Tepidimonas alkaliphilus]|uniref:Uncharacterized protein n=1 Tax=Tepidimonas alkaliphilus TaxID=2588942 RepID=A0A554WB55_9BURK|nr:hypothetical protein [Tepidimonas alkaliphilus]TSE20801.1 hypothetical protein Talka_00464 [Tepidimonas alkaliphilus]
MHLWHLVAPAWVTGGLLGAVLAWRRCGKRSALACWGRETLWLALPGSAVLVGGLMLTDSDGRIATYAALVGTLGTLAAWRARRA